MHSWLQLARHIGRCHIHQRWRVLLLVLATAISGCTSSPHRRSPAGELDRELNLEPGVFSGFENTALGEPVEFESAIYQVSCYPLFTITGWSDDAAERKFTGRILLWLDRAHVVGGRVFVETCEHSAPFVASSSRVEGDVSDWWFEAALTDVAASPRVELRRLALPGYGNFSNPAFCGRYVAFWSLADAEPRPGIDLTANIAVLFDGRLLASQSFGVVELETDNRWHLSRPAWTTDCLAATFDGPNGAGVVRADPK